MKSKEELNALKEEVENLNKKLAELTEEELAQVTGGVSKEAIFKVIDTYYAWVPGSIRTAIKNAYTTLGAKAARKLGEKLLEGYPGAVKMLDMFSD